MRTAKGRVSVKLTLIDRYLLRLMATPMIAALLVTLSALLLERVLRLFELLTGKGAPLGLVVSMAVNLVPHYLGLALPAAFAVGIIGVMASLSSENEVDAMEASGLSVRRIGAGFVASGALLAVVSIGLFGYAQPYSRYAFADVRHQLINAAWDARVEEGVFVDAGEGMTISAQEVDPTGRFLEKVFVLQETPSSERILTAERGVLIPNVEAGLVRLRLVNGVAVSIGEDEGELSATFDSVMLERTFDINTQPFRPRGGSERELTLNELWVRITGEDGLAPPEPRYASELHARLVRALALIGVPLIAVPLAVAGKRSPVWRRMVVAIALLVIFQNLTKTIEALADNGGIDPALGIWSLCAVYFAIGLWLYSSTASQGSGSPAQVMFVWFDRVLRNVRSFVLRRLCRDDAEAQP